MNGIGGEGVRTIHLESGENVVIDYVGRPPAASSPDMYELEDNAEPGWMGWKKVRNNERFRARFEMTGESLKRNPRGFDPEHPLIEDIKRKDFIGMTKVPRKFVTGPDLIDAYGELCSDGASLVRWLSRSAGVPF